MVKTKSNLAIKFSLVLIFILGFWGAWSYIQTEIISSSTDLKGIEICKTTVEDQVKYYKLLSYNKLVGNAELLCIRTDQSQTTYHKLNLVKTDFERKENWKIIYTQKVYADGSFFWPVYI